MLTEIFNRYSASSVWEAAEGIIAANPGTGDLAMTEPVELRTERLLMRPSKPDDVEEVFTYASDPDWARYLTVCRRSAIMGCRRQA